jgi:hypothetical protein
MVFKPKVYSENPLIDYVIQDIEAECVLYFGLYEFEVSILNNDIHETFDPIKFAALKSDNTDPKQILKISRFKEILPLLNFYIIEIDKRGLEEGWGKLINERYEKILEKLKP